ncbi:MAG: vWA domain-containing protein, partial [Planctomycetota bacterium]
IGSVGTTGASGAIDRLTHEILASLENRPTLVVWLFDQSGSLQAERDAILERFDRIYEELGVVEASQNPAFRKHEDKPLLTAVVGFGETPRMLTERPTDQLADIKAAVARIEDDQTGRENVFQAVGLAAEKFRTYRLARQNRRHVMMIVFTDEAGDDVDALDDAVRICRKHAMSVYVVGRPAPMGRETAYVKWVDPDPNFDQRPQWVPVRLGPESLVPERLKLGFVGGGAQGALLDSGFGPYALTRLCYETGGIYFAVHPNRVVGRSVSGRETSNLAVHLTEFFDPEVMRRYQPDYVSVAEYQRMLRGNRAKAALVAAAQASWTSPMENVRLRFPKRDEARLAESLSIAQRSAAFLQPQIDQICQTLLAGENDRSRLSEPRWQAGYDLATGRALAVQVRTAAYNAALAEAKQGMEFKSPESNTWILKSDDEYANSALSKTAAKATDYLMRVTEDHCETPWALLAQRELTQPFGWRWSEGFTPLPPEGSSRGRGQNRPRRENRPAKRPPRRDPPPL